MVAGGDCGFARLGWLVVTVGLQWFVFVCDFGSWGLGGGGGGVGGGCGYGWWWLWLWLWVYG